MEKNHFERNPLMPYVTLDEAFAFDPERPETRTCSTLVNAVLEAMHKCHPSTLRNVADYLDVDEHDLMGALRIATGYTYLEFRYHIILRRLEVLKQEHKHVISDKIAQELGFADHSSLSRFLNNQKTQKALADEGPSRHAKPCPGRALFG